MVRQRKRVCKFGEQRPGPRIGVRLENAPDRTVLRTGRCMQRGRDFRGMMRVIVNNRKPVPLPAEGKAERVYDC